MPTRSRRRFLRNSLTVAGLGLLTGCGLLPLRQQPPAKLYRIGFLTSDSTQQTREEALRQALHTLGYVEGQTVTIEFRRSDEGERLRASAHELTQLGVGVIITGSGPASVAAKSITSTVPIVMAYTDDPVGIGLVASLNRPGGNVTGLTSYIGTLAGKRLELLKEIVPALARVAILWNAASPTHAASVRAAEDAARTLGVEPHSLEIREPGALEAAFESATKEWVGAVMTTPSPFFGRERTRFAELGLKHRLPIMSTAREGVIAGTLLSYAPDPDELFRRAATYVDKILKGASPADLPIEQPTTFEFSINLKTAHALRLTIPQSILAQATEIIQ